MDIVFNGFKFGIALAFLIGPVFFTIIQTSIERGFWKGALVALGVSLSDTVYVAICYFGLFQFLNEPKFRTNMAYVGGIILILFACYHLFVKTRKARTETAKAANEVSSFKYFVKGFIQKGTNYLFSFQLCSLPCLALIYSRHF
jgi:threonine/homoserine/homoserine lactone efflux protein